MPRFLLPPDRWDDPQPVLDGDEARHLCQVLRAKRGDQVTVFDGCGRRGDARIVETTRDGVRIELSEVRLHPPPRPAITLALGIPKGKTMDLVVQKAVELGVAAIQPLVTRNTVVQPGDGKATRWIRTALEACKQCGLDTLPKVADPMPIEDWLDREAARHGLLLIASLANGSRPLRDTLRETPAPSAVTLLVGPEGDFTNGETRAALDRGFLPISFGTIVLRVETAALAGLAALRYEYGS